MWHPRRVFLIVARALLGIYSPSTGYRVRIRDIWESPNYERR